MENTNQLGASWENDSLHFVESKETSPKKIFHIPFEPRPQTPTKKGSLDIWEKELVIRIKGAIKEHRISSSTINLALPTTDIIFRSFIIPWMQPNEVKNVVNFEVSKYIPFPLDELTYSFHPVTISDASRRDRKSVV